MSANFANTTNMFKMNTTMFERATQGVPAEQWLERPGDDSNPLAWIVGHVVVHRAKVARLLGLEWSAPWEKFFERGAPLVASEQYPDAAELQRSFQQLSQKVESALPAASEDLLNKPVPKESPSLDGTVGGTIALLCLHETYHMGQLGYLRKWLGRGRAVG